MDSQMNSLQLYPVHTLHEYKPARISSKNIISDLAKVRTHSLPIKIASDWPSLVIDWALPPGDMR